MEFAAHGAEARRMASAPFAVRFFALHEVGEEVLDFVEVVAVEPVVFGACAEEPS